MTKIIPLSHAQLKQKSRHRCIHRVAAVFAAGITTITGIAAVWAQEPGPQAGCGWVSLYDDKGFRDRRLTIRWKRDGLSTYYGDQRQLKGNIRSDDGKKGFNDKTSSVKYCMPKGWSVVLYDDSNYKDSPQVLAGTDTVKEIPDLGSFSDKTSSLRFERSTE